MYKGELEEFLEKRISSAKAGNIEVDFVELELHAPEQINYGLLIGCLDTKTSICFAGCGCSSGSVPSGNQDP